MKIFAIFLLAFLLACGNTKDEMVNVTVELIDLPPPPPINPEELPPFPPPPSPPLPDSVFVELPESKNFLAEKSFSGAGFPGGQEALMKYLVKNIRFSPICNNQITGSKLFIGFVITETGELRQIKILKNTVCPSKKFENGIIDIFKNMPCWNPEIKDGKPVSVHYSMPIILCLKSQ